MSIADDEEILRSGNGEPEATDASADEVRPKARPRRAKAPEAGIDLSKFVPDAGRKQDASGSPASGEVKGPDGGDVPGEAGDDVSDEELEKVRPLVGDDQDAGVDDEGAGDEDEREDGAEERGGGAPVEPHLRAAVEAVIFAADEPVSAAQVAKAIGAKPSKVKRAILEIQGRLDSTGSGLLLQELAGGFAFTTHAEHAPAIRALRKTSQGRKLSPAAVDTLAIVAYKQPVQRQEIEDIRGVASCGPMLRQLMELDLVKIVGRAEVLGKPLLYGTTKRFLDMFGLADVKDLPKVSELEPK